MIHSLRGKLITKQNNFVVLTIDGTGINVKILLPSNTIKQLPSVGSRIQLFCFIHFQKDLPILYGFTTKQALEIFETLISINGIGPKAAIQILNTKNINKILSAIKQGKIDFLINVAGIGRKKAAKIIFELQDRLHHQENKKINYTLQEEDDLVNVLQKLGYRQQEIRSVILQLPDPQQPLEKKLKLALKMLSSK
jgi:Holliday junction DNA helicase RuvA